MTDNEKIVIAMSGGVDSSVAAGIMKERGFDAVGVSLQLWNYSNSDNRFGTCCSLDDMADARRVAERVGIPFYILNMEKKIQGRGGRLFHFGIHAGKDTYPLHTV